MDLFQNVISSNNSKGFGLQTNFINKKSASSNLVMKTNYNSVYYAKKGEPMYMKEMDEDEDGIVSIDEFKDYCKENDISSKEMAKMMQLASSYRIMQEQKKEESKKQNKYENQPEETEVETEAIYAKRGDSKYDETMDLNNDDKVSYKEYIEYCQEHAKTKDKKSDTKISELEDEVFNTISTVKILNSYVQSETELENGFVDKVV